MSSALLMIVLNLTTGRSVSLGIGLVPPHLAAGVLMLTPLPHVMCEVFHTSQRAGDTVVGRRYDLRCCESAPQPKSYFHVSVKWLTRLFRFPLSIAPHRPRLG